MKKIRLPGPYKIKPAIPHLFELPVPYDALVAATEECLHGYAGKDWVDFEKIHETPGSTKYQLSHYELVNLGTLTIRKLRDDLSEVHFSGPPSAASQRRKPTQEELAEIESTPNKDEMVKARIALTKKIKKEANDKYNRRKDHLGDVITAYLDRLSRENFGPKESLPEKPQKPIPPRKPQPVKSSAELDVWFDWYHDMKEAGYKCKLKDIAKENGFAHGTVKQLHPIYMRKRGLY